LTIALLFGSVCRPDVAISITITIGVDVNVGNTLRLEEFKKLLIEIVASE
jgi:hypothetical protein